jgi:hypothetical protein
MQSLYNIAGFLGAQSRSNPSDHGNSWHSHQAAKLQSPSQDDTSSPAFIEQLYQGCLEVVAEQLKKPLIPLEQLDLSRSAVEEIGLTAINLSTIKVGDTVKLVSDAHLNAGWARDLTLGNTYRVVEVDHDSTNMPIMISDDIQDHIWVFHEDFQQVT